MHCQCVNHLLNKAEEYQSYKKHGLALTYFQIVTFLEPESFRGWYGMAVVFIDLKDLPQALSSVDKALSIDPLNEQALSLRGCLKSNWLRQTSKHNPNHGNSNHVFRGCW